MNSELWTEIDFQRQQKYSVDPKTIFTSFEDREQEAKTSKSLKKRGNSFTCALELRNSR